MPVPLNSRSSFVKPGALVVLRGDDYNRLFAIWQAVSTGSLQIVYASSGVQPGFAIPADLANPVTLVLPPPTVDQLTTALGLTTEQVTFYDKNCNPIVRTVLTGATLGTTAA